MTAFHFATNSLCRMRPSIDHRSMRHLSAVALAMLLSLAAADSAFANDKTRNTLIGAGLGAAGGALLTHGDPWGAIGGAAAGGLIGNVLTNDRHHDRRWNNGRDRNRRDGRYDHRR